MRQPRKPTEEPTAPERILITGFPSFMVRRLATHILASDPRATVLLLAASDDIAAAREFAEAHPNRGRLETVVGRSSDMDLGLSGQEYRTVCESVTTVHHVAASYDGSDDALERTNVGGTRNVLTMCGEAQLLRRLCHWSSATVSGKRKGIILEEELDEGQAFHNAYERTQCAAEQLVRLAQRQLPITILRPGIIVGDSKTGEIDAMAGPHYLIGWLVNNTLQLRMPVPGRGTAPMHLVPIDFIIRAAYQLATDESAADRTYHLTDPNPFSARRLYELLAEHSNGSHAAESKWSPSFVPAGIARTLLKTPGLERLTRAPLSLLESLDHQCFYNCRNTLESLEDTGIRCPPLDRYIGNLVDYQRKTHAARKRRPASELHDPLDD